MSEEQHQSSKEYLFQVVTLPNTVPLEPHDQATMPQDCAVRSALSNLSLVSSTHSQRLFQINPAQELALDDIFVPPPAAFHEPHPVGHAQYYGTIPVRLVSAFTKENLCCLEVRTSFADRWHHIHSSRRTTTHTATHYCPGPAVGHSDSDCNTPFRLYLLPSVLP
jgi:hypothetical protein